MAVDPGAESLAILFDRSGVLTDIMQQISWLHNSMLDERFTACKTQFGTIDSHIRIIELLYILKGKYITDLIINDEGSYWNSRDLRLLAEKRTVKEHYMRHTERVIGYIAISCDDVQDSEAVTSHVEEALLEAEKEGILHH